MKPASAGRQPAIEQVLLEYRNAAGKSLTAAAPPPLLLSYVTEVLHLAIGRGESGGGRPASGQPVQEAACAFVRSVLLHAQSDHYALLGLDRKADAEAVKARYRLMMRLLHPDFGSDISGRQWPVDAAARINRAYEILGSPTERAAYDETLSGSSKSPRAPRPGIRPAALRAVRSRPAADPRRFLKQLATTFGASGAMAALVLVFAGGSDKDSLVQHTVARPRAQQVTPPPSAGNDPLRTEVAAPAPPASAQEAAVVNVEPEARPGLPALPPLAFAMQTSSAPTRMPVLNPYPPAAPLPAGLSTRIAIESTPTAPPARILAQAPPAAPASLPVPTRPTVTLSDAHPLLSALLQQMETGRGDGLLLPLQREARTSASAQALLAQYNTVTERARSVKVADVEFKAEPREDRLLVTGRVVLDLSYYLAASRSKELSVLAEFAYRDGAVVMTRLGPAGGSSGEKAQ